MNEAIENNTQSDQWTMVIEPAGKGFNLRLDELWRYRDLVYLFVHRDFVAQYKQTLLGPAWHFIQPLLTTVMFTIVFGKIAKISTDGLPPFLFYMAGTIIWTYFANVLTGTSNTFVGSRGIFGKVYFPRLAVPVSVLVSKLVAFAIQFVFFLGFLIYFALAGADVSVNAHVFLTPILLVMMAALGLGLGIIVSSMTTRYRDLTVLVGFGVQLFMYATPVIYPLSEIPEDYRWLLLLNPIAPIVETFRYAFLGAGTVEWAYLGISALTITGTLIVGIAMFNRIERTFMDTV